VLSDLWFRIRSLVFSTRADADLDDELQFHLECERAKLASAGLDETEARRRSAVAFGGVSGVADACRDARGVSLIADLSRDLRYAVRSLRHTPIYALTIVGSLVLGIGANVTVFTLMHAALWRAIPVSDPEEIVHVRRANPARSDGRETSVSYTLFRELRDAAGSSARIVAKGTPRRRAFGLDPDSKERVTVETVTDDFFGVLGIAAAAGRLFVPGDDGPSGGRRVAVLSHRFWTTRFSEDPSVIGRAIYVDETAFTVVGIAARTFEGADAERRVQVWLPVTADVVITPDWLQSHSYYWLTLIARLTPGGNARALEGALDTRFHAHLEHVLLPGMPARLQATVRDEHLQLRPAAAGLATTGRRYESQLWVLAGIAACVLLIAGANVGNLVRARNTRRQDEFALRRALGASGPRLFRQLLVEGLLLAVIGTAGSLLAAPWIGGGILALLPATEPLTFDLAPDWTVFTLAALLGLAVALVAITIPAWRPATVASHAGASRVTRRPVTSRAAVALQLATVLVLLVVAGLCVAMLQDLRRVDLGFAADPVATAELTFPRRVPPAAVASTLEHIRQRLAETDTIESSSYAFPSVYDIGGTSMGIAPVGYTAAPGEDIGAGTIVVGPGFFSTLQIAMREGRDFDQADMRGEPSVVVVNETFARRYFKDRSALGESVRLPAMPAPRVSRIVGVVADVRHYGVRSQPWPMVYQPGGSPGAHLLVRGRGQATTSAAIRAAAASVGAPAQVESIRPLTDVVAAMVSRERLLAVLSSGVAIVALSLAVLGLYGVVAYGVACRRSEIAIRLALGARRLDVQRLVMRDTLAMVVIGVACGLAGAIAAAGVLGRLVPSAPAPSGPLLARAALGLAAVALTASWIPSWRASRTDPMTILRTD
jgi:putative ABC transport system permease protein